MEKDKDSYYTEIGSVLVRVSNHCTHMKTWEQIFNNNPKLRKSKILSIVFEDTADTFIPECLFQVCPRTHSIEVDEYVYRIHGNGTLINSSDINMIIKALQDIAYGNYYKDPTKKSEYFHRKSFFPDYGNIEITPDGRSIPAGFNGVDYPIEETKNYKNMKKNVQRINESQLRAIVAESVKKVLTEATDDLPEAIEMQDKFAEAILFKLRELETFWWEKHKTPYPYSREVLKKALKGYDWEHKQGGEGLEYCGFER